MRLSVARSLTLRLTLLFAAASSVVLLLLGFLIGASVDQHFEDQDREALAGKLQLAQHALAKVRSPAELAALPPQLAATLVGDQGLAMMVMAPDGSVLFATDGAEFPNVLLASATAGASTRPLRWTTRARQPLRGISGPAPTSIDGAPAAVVAVALDIAHHQHFMTSFRLTLWSFVVVAALTTGLLGWVAARRGLAPLQAIRRQAANITAHRLDARLPVEAVPAELRELVDTLNAMLVRLEASFRQLSDFSSDIAHELRTPVSNLLTQTQVMLSRDRSGDDYRDVLASNCEEFERLSRMIADMLFLAKADNQLIVPHRETVNLGDEVRSLFEFYGILADDKAIVLTCTGSAEVSGDRLMLRRAVSNLLSNALRHTPSGGRVDVDIAASAAGQAGDAAHRDAVRVSVANSGSRIAAEHLPRLFDRFYRVDSARHRSSEGVGLGLAITRSIARAHGGDVAVRSDASATVFELTVAGPPLAADSSRPH